MSEQTSSGNTVEQATGRWHWILTGLGINSRLLRNQHGPCPVCGGEDRFRFDDKGGRGTYYCNVCGAGDGMDLAQRWLGCGFADAAKQIDALLGRDDKPDKDDAFKPQRSLEQIRSSLNHAWSSAVNGEIAIEYLRRRKVLSDGRGLTDIRGARRAPYFVNGRRAGVYPAMIGLVRSQTGEPVSVHRTYLISPTIRKKKLMTPLGNLTGSYIELAPSENGAMIYAEGIESALAGREIWLRTLGQSGQMYDAVGVRSAISAGNLVKQKIPREVEHVIICVDVDLSFAGQAAAYELARKAKADKRSVTIIEPTDMASDVADCLTDEQNVPRIQRSRA